MSTLFEKVKSIVPDATEEEVNNAAQQFRAVDPSLTDDQLIQIAQKAIQSNVQPQSTVPEAQSELQAAESAGSERFKRSIPGQVVKGLGSAFAERSPQIKTKDEFVKEETVKPFTREKLAESISSRKAGEKKTQEESALKAKLDDPNSEESKLAQGLLSKIYPDRDFGQFSASQLDRVLPGALKVFGIESEVGQRQSSAQRAQAKEERLSSQFEETKSLQKGEIERRKSERGQNVRDKIINDFNKDAAVKKLVEQESGAVNALNLINLQNPVADEAVKTFLARASGEVGNLARSEQERFGGSPAVKNRIQRLLTKSSVGTLPSEDRQFLREIASAMQKNSRNRLKERAGVISKQKSKAFDMNQADVLDLIGFKSTLSPEEQKRKEDLMRRARE